MTSQDRGFQRILRIVLRRKDADRAVSDEITFHIAMTARELEEQGMDPTEALAEAERRFGDREGHAREARRIARRNYLAGTGRRYLQEGAQDLGFAWSALRRRPLFTVSATLLLALGVAAFATVFSFMEAVLLRPFSLPEPQRIVRIERRLEDVRPGRLPFGNLNYDDIRYLAENSTTLEDIAGMMAGGSLPLTGLGPAGRVPATRVTEGFFTAAGVFPRMGRPLTRSDLEPGAEPVVVISHGTWVDRFGSDSNVLDQQMMLNWVPHRIVGVMPPGFSFPDGSELWAPLPVGAMGRFLVFTGIARLAEGVGIQQATAEVTGLLKGRRGADDSLPAGTARLTPWHARVTERVRPAVLMLTGASLLLLLVVAVNIGGLMLARTAARQRELAVRRSLGASEDRIRSLLVAESLLVGLGGGLLGLCLCGHSSMRWSP